MKPTQKLANPYNEKHLQSLAIKGSLVLSLTWLLFFWFYQHLTPFTVELTGWSLMCYSAISQILVFSLIIISVVVVILIFQGIQASFRLRKHQQIILKEIEEYLSSLEAKGHSIQSELRKEIIDQALKTGYTGLN